METFVRNESVFYDLPQTGSTGVLIRLSSTLLSDNSTLPQQLFDGVPSNVKIYNNDTKLYIPGCEFLISMCMLLVIRFAM